MAACLILMVFSTTGHAYHWYNVLYMDNLEIRPDIGYGYAVSKDHERGMGYHAGARILSNANADKRYGIEISYVSPFASKKELDQKNYIASGIILEQVLREQFVITIATLGYIGIDQNKNNPFGFVWDLGWEPKIREHIQLFVALHNETIFDVSTIDRHSVSIGLKF
jgi:hypothetical protein